MNVTAVITSCASGVVVLTALGHVARKVVKWFLGVGAAVELAASRSAQLENNGGSSMRDTVDRIEAHLKRQDAAIADLQDHRRARPRLRH